MTTVTTQVDMTRSRSWVAAGTRLLLDAVDRLQDPELDEPSALPQWTRRHLIAHVTSNAQAIGRLLGWARTGVENRMYASAEQRLADIEAGAVRVDLRDRVHDSAATLEMSMDATPDAAWSAEVVTAQGRTVPASGTPWMRAREVCVHAVDLDAGVAFRHLPEDFLVALVDDVVAWRAARPGPSLRVVTPLTAHDLPGDGEPRRVTVPLATAAAWLTGRRRDGLPELPPWL